MWLYWNGPKLAQYTNVSGSVMFHEEEANHGPVRVNSNDKRSEHNVCFVDGHVKWVQHSKFKQATINGGNFDLHWYWNTDLGDY
jgi:prepilin-type processing-associated H-X9-DG protein